MGSKKSNAWNVERYDDGVDIYWDHKRAFRIYKRRNEDGIYTYALYMIDVSLSITPQQLGVGLSIVADEYERYAEDIANINAKHAKKIYEKYGEEDNV